MKTASKPTRILNIDMSVSSTQSRNALVLSVLPQPRLQACHANRAARCAKTSRMTKLTTKIKHFCIASPFIQFGSRRSSDPGKIRRKRPANRQHGSHHLLAALSCRSASSACFSQSSAIFKSAALSLLFIRSAIRRQSSAKVRYVFASRIYSSACPRAES